MISVFIKRAPRVNKHSGRNIVDVSVKLIVTFPLDPADCPRVDDRQQRNNRDESSARETGGCKSRPYFARERDFRLPRYIFPRGNSRGSVRYAREEAENDGAKRRRTGTKYHRASRAHLLGDSMAEREPRS